MNMIAIMKKSIGVVILIFIFLVAASVMVHASPPTPPGPVPGTNETYIGGVPIAGGVLILIALALGYGARKLYNARKRRISE
ncbi:MAG: hypothetical protein RQ761_07590 [Bacteroidales bacterium]|nr:hypothetical protein [Bacteroidales bacterium]